MAVAITTQPSSKKCLIGGRFSLSVVASGAPSISYQWWKDGALLSGETASSISRSGVSKTDSGTYYCVVSGSDTSTTTSALAAVSVVGNVCSIPELTGPSSGIVQLVSASSEDTDSQAWMAFDRKVSSSALNYVSISDSWATPAGLSVGWLRVQFQAAKDVRSYWIYPHKTLGANPRSWTFEGSNDGSSWTILDSRSNVTAWSTGNCLKFSIPLASYVYYRINISQNQGTGADFVGISELLIYSDATLDVSITSPSPGSRIQLGSSIDIEAEAESHSTYSITASAVYANSGLVGTGSSASISETWTPAETGVYLISVVATNSVGESVESVPISLIADQTAVVLPPTVSLTLPVDGSIYNSGSEFSISYYATPGTGATLDHIDILIEGDVVATFTSESASHVVYDLAPGTYAIKAIVYDSESNSAESDEISITVSSDDAVPTVGSVATLKVPDFELLDSTTCFVWRLWDGSVKHTAIPITQHVINRPLVSFQVAVHDSYGRSSVSSLSIPTVDPQPKILGSLFKSNLEVLPYSVDLVVSATDGASVPVIVWKDANGVVLSASDPITDGPNFTYRHIITKKSEKISLYVFGSDNAASKVELDFTFPGIENQVPVLSAPTLGLAPVSWSEIAGVAFVATTEPLFFLGGNSEIDGIQIPGYWSETASGYAKTAAAVVLVKNQNDSSSNGLYSAESTALPYEIQSGSSYVSGKCVLTTDGSTIRISKTTFAGKNAASVLEDGCQVGRLLIASGAGGFVQWLIAGVVDSGTHYTVSVSQLTDSGTLPSAINIQFSWKKLDVQFSPGSTVKVVHGSVNGGHYFSISADYDDGVARPGQIQFVRADADYSGVSGAGNRMYMELATRDVNGLDLELSAVSVGASTAANLSGSDVNVLRLKSSLDTIGAGKYEISATVANAKEASGFNPLAVTSRGSVRVL